MILISGASRGIGKFLMDRYLDSGERVIGLYNQTVPETGLEDYRQLDVTDEAQIAAFVEEHRDQLTDIRYVHCAGVNHNCTTHRLESEQWKWVLQGNLESAFLMTKHLLPLMRQQKFGRILFCSSIVSQIGVPGTAAYSSSKSGLWGLMKAIARENASGNVTCNTLNLGYFDIGMITEVPAEMLAKIVETIPMRRLGDPESIYGATRFVFDCGYMTGTQINISGGMI